jgi:glycosyltransferase involved in cell wall biosynthesis
MTSGEVVIAISGFIRDYILSSYRGIDPARVKVIARGIDRQRYPFAYRPSAAWLGRFIDQYPASAGRRLLVLPGRLTRWKGQEEFIRVMDILVRQNVPVHGLIAGGAAGRQLRFERELHELVAARNLADHISFLGHRDDLREVLAHADIAYSLTLQPEAFGRTTLEALSLGTPVVGYDHGGTGEILRDVQPEGLVPVRDIDAVVAATRRLLTTPVALPASHAYTLQRMQAETVDTYERLAAR